MMKQTKIHAFLIPLLLLTGCNAMKNKIGMTNNKFNPCPGSPNCVSSMSENKKHHISPISYNTLSPNSAKQLIITILQNKKRYTILTNNKQYLHATYTSSFFKFVDDIEFYLPPDKKIIHIKSASRVGYFDFSANRRRLNKITKLFQKLVKKQ